MKPVLIPTTDVNSETGLLVEWLAGDRSEVKAGETIAEIETSKAIIEVPAPEAGVLLHDVHAGTEVRLSAPVAFLFDDTGALEAYAEEQRRLRAEAAESGPRATAPARRRAEELGVDLASIGGDSLITVGMVEAAAAAGGPGKSNTASVTTAAADLPDPLPGTPGVPRIALVGAGLGATQVIDILRAAGSGIAVAAVDDDASLWSDEVMGVPVVGGLEHLVTLFGKDAFDAAIITISTSVPARVRLRAALEANGIPLANAIDPTARVASGVTFGTGNVVAAFCHFGVGTVVGDNNFLSAYNSYDHHNRLGSDISTGPGCMTSGLVMLGDRVRLGTGIYVEPHVELGDDVQVASGSVIVASVPAGHVVKRRVVTTAVVPRRS
ncbi:MAG TPA: biotin/lipoyl-containing protein [Streptosporangiaceae bacterium]|nr:biotin/lipoyl-containing protein [Streptosporangiaceae bacterium]